MFFTKVLILRCSRTLNQASEEIIITFTINTTTQNLFFNSLIAYEVHYTASQESQKTYWYSIKNNTIFSRRYWNPKNSVYVK